MKKTLYVAAAMLCLAIAYLAGYSSKAPEATKSGTHVPAGQATVGETVPGTVQVSPEKQQVMGVRIGVVERAAETHTLRILGRVAADEARVYQINAAVDGWVRRLYRNQTGTLVRKDEVLAAFYSPEFLSAQQAYIFAVNSQERFKEQGQDTPGQVATGKYSIQQYADTLRNLGMTETQIEEIARKRERTQNIEIRSPAAGFVVARNISLGSKFGKGTELFRIADLRRVWISADLFQNEARYVRPGTLVKVTLPGEANTMQARVTDVLPQFDPATRTLKVRLEADNPGYILRPDMFVDLELPVTFPPAVTVPADAVLDSGLRRIVFVDLGNGFFEPRDVITGWRFANRVEIVKGLEPGERIVISGNFLIDSESRMELTATGLTGALARDAVCGADVSMKKAMKDGRVSVYKGKTYFFSSRDCKDRFDREPDRYAAKAQEEND